MTHRLLLLVLLALVGLACRSPLTALPPHPPPVALDLAVHVEDHSRHLARLEDPAPGTPDTPATRHAALDRHRAAFEADLRTEASRRGLQLDPKANLRLDLTITSLGEVRTRYIVWGILSGVGWGVGVGLVAHDPRLAVGLGAYELVEESAFWIGGAVLAGRWSSPAVVEARLLNTESGQPVWEETYFVLWARKELEAFPAMEQRRRDIQLRASLRKVLSRLFQDLEAMPGFPRAVTAPRLVSASTAPAPPPPG